MALMVRPLAYSGPQWMAAHPPSCSLRCHFCRRCWLASPRQAGIVAEGLGFEERRQVLVQPGPQLVAELLVLGRQGKIHGGRVADHRVL